MTRRRTTLVVAAFAAVGLCPGCLFSPGIETEPDTPHANGVPYINESEVVPPGPSLLVHPGCREVQLAIGHVYEPDVLDHLFVRWFVDGVPVESGQIEPSAGLERVVAPFAYEPDFSARAFQVIEVLIADRPFSADVADSREPADDNALVARYVWTASENANGVCDD